MGRNLNICLKDESGQLPGKTTVFAITQAHAERLIIDFEEIYPQFPDLVRVITHDTERVRNGSWGDGLITQFKKRSMPRITISVDMLDTSIDVPEIVNLVFMKPVRSRIKSEQMIGRATRSNEAYKYKDRLPKVKRPNLRLLTFGKTISTRKPRKPINKQFRFWWRFLTRYSYGSGFPQKTGFRAFPGDYRGLTRSGQPYSAGFFSGQEDSAADFANLGKFLLGVAIATEQNPTIFA